MSVELLDSPRFYGYRVRRQIGGKAYQEYLSLIKGGKRLKGKHRILIKNQAEQRDAELKTLQTKNKKRLDKTVKFNGKGQVKGILFRMKKERSGRGKFKTRIGEIEDQKTGKKSTYRRRRKEEEGRPTTGSPRRGDSDNSKCLNH